MINRWYLTPCRLAKMFGHQEGTCWWCQSVYADYIHMWWSCPRIYAFWGAVNIKIKQISGTKLPLTPRVMLLLDSEYGRIIIGKELLAHILTAATLLIAKWWKLKEEVSVWEWIMKIRYMCLINKLTAIIRNRKCYMFL